MKFSGSLLSLALISSAYAGPVVSERAADDLSIVSEEVLTIQGIKGTFTVYDNKALPLLTADSADGAPALQRRCGSNQVRCDYQSYRADTRICGLLMDAVGGDARLSASQLTDLCFTVSNPDLQGNPRCCMSWPRRISGLVRGHLLGAATASFRCDRDTLVSAYVSDVDLNGYCTVQCLSNRPDGCV